MQDGIWRTVGGRRIFIKNGQDLVNAMKESGKFNRKKLFSEDIISKDFSKLPKDKESLAIYEYKTQKLIHLETSDSDNSVGSDEIYQKLNSGKKNSLVAVHNHPRNSSFSINDLNTFNMFKSLHTIMVVTDNYLYFVEKNGINKIDEKLFSKVVNTSRTDYFEKYGRNYPTIHKSNKDICERLGWKYGRYKRH